MEYLLRNMLLPGRSSFIRPEEFWRFLGLRAEQTVVHLGCGAGFYLVPAAKIVGRKGKAIGIDILPDMLAEVENRAQRLGVSDVVQTLCANVENDRGSTLSDAIADWVLVANILHQADPAKVLIEAKRLAKQDGIVVVVEWDVIATPLGPPPNKRRPRATILQIALSLGLKEKESFAPSPYHYGFLLAQQS